MIGSIGATEWLWIALFILLLLVGSKKLPELAKALGRSMGEFEKGRREIEKELREAKSPTQDPEREKLERAAKDLGIQTEGKTTQQLKEEIAKAVSS
jgi:sec-independent protein translocase protein TatA